MNADLHARAKAIFIAALALQEDLRQAFVEKECDGDAGLVELVNRLLEFATEPGLTDQSQLGAGPFASSKQSIGPTDQLASGDLFANRYRIMARLGAGGMGTVYRANDQVLKQEVALKLLAPEYSSNEDWLNRFKSEVRLAREVTHANVCRVYDIGFADGICYLSMEYVDGDDLGSLLRRVGRVPPDRARGIAIQICMALAALHRKGVLHRDIKPANVMIDGKGDVRLTDFGLATHDQLHGLEAMAGTPAYMAPEQIAGQEVTVRSEIYSVGLLLFELFTGHRAFIGKSMADYRKLHAESRPPTPSSVVEDLPAEVDRVILQCLEKEPANRPESVDALAVELGADVLGEMMRQGETPSPTQIAAAGTAERIGLRSVVFILLLTVICAGLHAFWNPDASREAGRVPQKSPVVLADRANELTAILSPAERERDRADGLISDPTCNFFLDDKKPRMSLRASNDRQVLYWQRTARRGLVPISAEQVLLNGARTTLDDPSPTMEPGTTIILDGSARLVGFERIASTANSNTDNNPNWLHFFDAAGLDMSEFRPEQSLHRSRLSTDVRLAWGNDNAIRVEAATVSGLPTLFAVLDTAATPPSVNALRLFMTKHAWTVLLLSLLIVSVPLAYMNLKRGRSDPRGARRVASFVFIGQMLVWALSAHHTTQFFAEFGLVLFASFAAVGIACIFWLFYIALEPYLRRFWPNTLVTWSRITTGRWYDALVGWHILIGTALGLYLGLLTHVDLAVTRALGFEPRITIPRWDTLTPLLGSRYMLSALIGLLLHAIYDSLSLLLLGAILRATIRKTTPAALLAVLLISLLYIPRGTHPIVSTIVICVLGVSVVVWAMTRFGLVVVVVALFVGYITTVFPVALEFRNWTADVALASLIGLLSLACVAAWVARHAPSSLGPKTKWIYETGK